MFDKIFTWILLDILDHSFIIPPMIFQILIFQNNHINQIKHAQCFSQILNHPLKTYLFHQPKDLFRVFISGRMQLSYRIIDDCIQSLNHLKNIEIIFKHQGHLFLRRSLQIPFSIENQFVKINSCHFIPDAQCFFFKDYKGLKTFLYYKTIVSWN